MKKRTYEAPSLDVIYLAMEQGLVTQSGLEIAKSTGQQITDEWGTTPIQNTSIDC